MTARLIFLDAGPLGIITQRPGKSPVVDACHNWMASLIKNGDRLYVPEIADFEVRRELLRAGKTSGVARLDAFIAASPDRYIAVTTRAMRLAADLWAQTRRQGIPTADPQALDGDVIIAAQALSCGMPQADIVVASVNVRHLSQYINANTWSNI